MSNFIDIYKITQFFRRRLIVCQNYSSTEWACEWFPR